MAWEATSWGATLAATRHTPAACGWSHSCRDGQARAPGPPRLQRPGPPFGLKSPAVKRPGGTVSAGAP